MRSIMQPYKVISATNIKKTFVLKDQWVTVQPKISTNNAMHNTLKQG